MLRSRPALAQIEQHITAATPDESIEIIGLAETDSMVELLSAEFERARLGDALSSAWLPDATVLRALVQAVVGDVPSARCRLATSASTDAGSLRLTCRSLVSVVTEVAELDGDSVFAIADDDTWGIALDVEPSCWPGRYRLEYWRLPTSAESAPAG